MNKPDLLTQLMGFLSTGANYLGLGIIRLVKYVLPTVKGLDALAEPVGYLALLTLFVVLTSAAQRIAFIILVAGWLLILIRLLLMTLRIG